MTTCTQAQISHDEALEAVRRFENLFWKRDPKPRIQIPARPNEDDDCILHRYVEQQRALTAAAQVGEPMQIRDARNFVAIKRATIERCAQVAEQKGNLWSNDAKAISEIAAAIRKLKDEP